MKYILFCLLVLLFPVTGNAVGEYYYPGDVPNVSDAIISSWGDLSIDPGFIQDANDTYGDAAYTEDGYALKIRTGWACCGTASRGHPTITTEDDESFLAMIAQKDVSEHGAKFCLTQVYAASSTTTFYIGYQQPNWPELQCAWFCEPGWDGIGCSEPSSEEHACNNTDYEAAIREIRSKPTSYAGNDSLTLSKYRLGVADLVAVLGVHKVNNFYPHHIILGAISFKQHGVVVAPMRIAAVGDHPAKTYVMAQKPASAKIKTLCAQGFTNGADCKMSSKYCGADAWCTGYSNTTYNKDKHTKKPNGLCNVFVCTEPDKGLNDNFDCIDCAADIREGVCSIAGADMGKCIKCKTGEFFDNEDCTCKTAKVLDQRQMQYGKHEGEVTTKQCWTMNDSNKFIDCMLEKD